MFMLLMFHRKNIYKKEIIDSLTSNISCMVDIFGHLEPNHHVNMRESSWFKEYSFLCSL